MTWSAAHVWDNTQPVPKCKNCGMVWWSGHERAGWCLVAYEAVTMPKPAGVKHDDGKLAWMLLPWSALEPVVRVLMHGARKYSPENWRLVLEASGGQDRYFDAALRHLITWRGGEALDPESGLPHLAHAVCCLLFILTTKDEA